MQRFLGVLLIGVFACSAARAAETVAAKVPVETKPATSWLDDKGALSGEQVAALLGVTPTPEQKAKIAAAAAARNAALEAVNAVFRAQLGEILATSDVELTKKAQAERERQRLELMRLRQPSRYQALKRGKK